MAYGNKRQKWFYYNSPPFIKNLITSVYGLQQKKSDMDLYTKNTITLLKNLNGTLMEN